MTAQQILFYLDGVKPQGTGWIARCPAHDDQNPSLKIDDGRNGRAVLHCFAKCSYSSIMAALGLPTGEEEIPWWKADTTRPVAHTSSTILTESPEPGGAPPPVQVPASRGDNSETPYNYEDELRRFLFQVVRREKGLADGSIKKTFVQRRRPRSGEIPKGDGWVYNLDGVPRVLYRLPDLAPAELVYVVEGEKDVETLRGRGLTATCNPGGAGKWRPEFNEYLRGKVVVILPDNDEPGRRHAEQVANSIYGIAKEVLMIHLPDLPPKGDVTDFIQSGHTADDLADLVQRADPWQPNGALTEIAPSNGDVLTDLGAGPVPTLTEAAFHGLVGEIVRTIEPHTEADPAALLFQLLAAFGCLVGRGAYFLVEATTHYPKLFTTLVGASSKARKGTSWSHIQRLLVRVDPAFSDIVQDGLSSGEGLIYHVRDPQTKKRPIRGKGGKINGHEDVIEDEGAKEKRAFIQEPEFARVLQAIAREGNTLSAVLRQAWDSDRIRTMTKTPLKASDAHVAIAGHITLEELRRNLNETETSNGFANRFLWVSVRRSKLLPFGGNLQQAELNPLVDRVREVHDLAKRAGEVRRDTEGDALWREIYEDLSAGAPGLFGSVTSRAEAQVMRLAMIYALLDGSATIRREHLEAGLAAWEYCSNSARLIFGQRTGDKVADKIMAALRDCPDGLSRTAIRDVFARNKDAGSIDAALRVLLEMGLIEIQKESTSGRSAEVITLRRYDQNDR